MQVGGAGETALPTETSQFVARGGALIIGAVDGDGAPVAARAWDLTVLPDVGDSARVRIVIDRSDDRLLDALAATSVIAVTATDVRTLRSIQLKGHASPVSEANDDDRARVRTYCDEFFDAIGEVDNIDRALLERLVPHTFVACEVTIDEQFDQTPGPDAGARIAEGDG